jgi:hypothetical protein
MTGFSVKELIVSTADGLNFTLVESFTFTRPNGEVVTVSAGATSDGASVPRAMWLTLPPFGTYWMAAFLHDDLYRRSDFDKEKCDTIFEEAMDYLKVGVINETRLYEGVEHLGAISYLEDRKGDLTMWAKIKAFFGGFFGNVAADPVSTIKGVVQLASAAAVGYGMSTGAVPIAVGAPMAASLAASGVHSLGTNTTTGVEAPAAVKTEAAIQTVTAFAPTALSVVDQVAAIKSAADDGQKKIDTYTAILSALASVLPPPTPPVPVQTAGDAVLGSVI